VYLKIVNMAVRVDEGIEETTCVLRRDELESGDVNVAARLV
jgi:hypothetical protein